MENWLLQTETAGQDEACRGPTRNVKRYSGNEKATRGSNTVSTNPQLTRQLDYVGNTEVWKKKRPKEVQRNYLMQYHMQDPQATK